MVREFLVDLGQVSLAASIALTLVLALRVPLRYRFGAAFAYRLWALVPIAALTTLLPAPERPLISVPLVASSAPAAAATINDPHVAAAAVVPISWQPYVFALWAAGVIALFLVFVRQQRQYLKNLGVLSQTGKGILRAQATAGCPALVGLLRPRIIVPSDFESRYTSQERELVLAHEHTHLARGDAQINALATLLRCLNWFNPLFHFATLYFRFDQEIACDAAVISRFPQARRCYADAMLKAQWVGEPQQKQGLPAGCLWPAGHPLKQRIAMLKFADATGARRALATLTTAVLILCTAYTTWAAQPPRTVPGAEQLLVIKGSVRQGNQVLLSDVHMVVPEGMEAHAANSAPVSMLEWDFGFLVTKHSAENRNVFFSVRHGVDSEEVARAGPIEASLGKPFHIKATSADGVESFVFDGSILPIDNNSLCAQAANDPKPVLIYEIEIVDGVGVRGGSMGKVGNRLRVKSVGLTPLAFDSWIDGQREIVSIKATVPATASEPIAVVIERHRGDRLIGTETRRIAYDERVPLLLQSDKGARNVAFTPHAVTVEDRVPAACRRMVRE